MNLPAQCPPTRLPKRFPVGTTYVVEGRGGENGHLRVFSRYVVLPGGQRINLTGDFGGPASPRGRAGRRNRKEIKGQERAETRPGRAKKIIAGGGTSLQHLR